MNLVIIVSLYPKLIIVDINPSKLGKKLSIYPSVNYNIFHPNVIHVPLL